jgi:hypothetical protein
MYMFLLLLLLLLLLPPMCTTMIDITHEQQPLGYGDAKNRYGKEEEDG